MAVLQRPKVLLVDEPSVGLSPAAIGIVFKELLRLHAAGQTILLVEQNTKKAMEVAERAVMLRLGKVIWDWPAGDDHPRRARRALPDRERCGARRSSALNSACVPSHFGSRNRIGTAFMTIIRACFARVAHQGFAQHGGRGSRARAEGRRPRYRRSDRGRAGLRHAREHQGGGSCGDRSGRDQVYAGQWNSGTCGKPSSATIERRLGLTYRDSEICVGGGAKQILFLALMASVEKGAGGHHPGSLLGVLPGHGHRQRRQAGHRGMPARPGFQAHPGRSRGSDHAAGRCG